MSEENITIDKTDRAFLLTIIGFALAKGITEQIGWDEIQKLIKKLGGVSTS